MGLLRYRLTAFYKMVSSLKVVLTFAIFSSTVAISTECRSDRDCQTFRRTSLGGQSYLAPGKCIKVPDIWCNIGNFFGKQNRCNAGSRCAECLVNQDCASGKECSFNSCRLTASPNKKCNHDWDCPGGQKCSRKAFETKKVCRDDMTCRHDRECGSRQKCSRYRCVSCPFGVWN